MRPKAARLVTRFEGLPGEFTQHDFGEVDVRFLDGTKRRVHFFASRLKYSRWTEVSLVPNQQVETLVRTMTDHFAAMGGVPLLAVFDRPTTIAKPWGRDGVVTEWNPSFAGVALDLGLGIELCWPRSPQQKGSVENLVKWVKGSFFKQRRFLDEEDLLQQLQQWLVDVNTQRPSRATGVIPAERLREELPRLRPLKVAPADLALRLPITVGPTGVVVHDSHEYSMSPPRSRRPGTPRRGFGDEGAGPDGVTDLGSGQRTRTAVDQPEQLVGLGLEGDGLARAEELPPLPVELEITEWRNASFKPLTRFWSGGHVMRHAV